MSTLTHLTAPAARFVPAVAAASLVACGVQARQPSVNMDQLRRVLQGETIAERDAGEEIDGDEAEFTDDFFIDECRFTPSGRNQFFSLEPGYQLHLSGVEDGETIDLFVTVLSRTMEIRMEIGGVMRRIKTRVIEERELVNNELVEISLNYYARCKQTNDVFYFGEDVCFYEDGECVGTGGSWRSGVNGAVPGIIMPGRFLIGAGYFQEQAPGVAMDLAENAEMGLTVAVPAGVFEDCVRIEEGSALPDAGASGEKIFAPGVGFIKEGALELVSYGFGGR